jgi:predicted kinase
MNKLVLVRGLPGSGKSTFAKSMPDFLHVEADMYFCKDGEYKFDPKLLADAHAWCRLITEDALHKKLDVIVTNTFTQFWEIRSYLDIASLYGIIPFIITVHNQFQNVHGVPEEKLEIMYNRFEWDISEKLKKYYGG